MNLFCTSCDQKKDIDSFYYNKSNACRSYRTYECKDCHRERKREYAAITFDKKCIECGKSFTGYKSMIFCSKICRHKVRNRKSYQKMKNTYAYTKKLNTNQATNNVLRKQATNLNKRFSKDEIKKIIRKSKGNYVYTSKELALEFRRTKNSIDLKRSRYAKNVEKKIGNS